MLHKTVWALVLAILVFACGACEFSFGEKQEPVFKGIADPGSTVTQTYSPQLISERMTEDLRDRGWIKKQTVIITEPASIAALAEARGFTECLKNRTVRTVTEVPYVKEVDPNKNVTLTFFDLGLPFDAFAAFTRARQLPMDEYYYGERELALTARAATFWEGPFLVNVSTANLGEDTRDILLGVAKGIAYKLYGLVGTYSDPEVIGLFPSYQRRANTIQVLSEDPFQLTGVQTALLAYYDRDAGENLLYVFTDPSAEAVAGYRNLLVTKLITPQAAILATRRTADGTASMWINTPEAGIIEIALKKNILAVQTGIAPFRAGIERIPGLREIATSGLVHENYNRNVTINPYKDILIIADPGKKINDIITLGITDDVMREVD